MSCNLIVAKNYINKIFVFLLAICIYYLVIEVI